MISVVLVNWNNSSDTINCIESLFDSDIVATRIIVVDNHSTDDSLAVFNDWTERLSRKAGYEATRPVLFMRYVEGESRFDGIERESAIDTLVLRVIFVESGRNGGFGFGCNVGMRLADTLGTDSYWLLNNDCLSSPDSISLIRNAVEHQPTVIFGAVVRNIEAPHAIQATGGGVLQYRSLRNTLITEWPLRQRLDFVYGASMAFSAQCRNTVGDFDEEIFMYYEEIDFCLRATRAGFSCGMVNTNIFHKQGGSQGGVSVSAWTHVLLNKYYVLHKHFGWGLWTIAFFVSLLLRCAIPIGGRKASLGARSALKTIIFKRRSP